MSGTVLIGLIVVVWLVVLAPLLLRGQKPIRKAGEAFDETRIILEGGSSVPVRRRPRLAGESDDADDEIRDEEHLDDDYEIVDSPSIFRHRREDVDEDTDGVEHNAPESPEVEPSPETRVAAAANSDHLVVTALDEDLDTIADTELVDIDDDEAEVEVVNDASAPASIEIIEEWNEEDHYPMDDSFTRPLDLMHHEERSRAIAEYQQAREAADAETADNTSDDEDSGELTQADVEFAQRRRGRGYYDPEADREFAQSQYIRRQRTLLGLGVGVLVTVILGFVFGGGLWALAAVTAAATAVYLIALRSQVRAENELRARRIRRLRRSRMGVRQLEDHPQRLRRPGAVVLELDDESPDFEGLDTTYLPVEQHEDRYQPQRTRRVS